MSLSEPGLTEIVTTTLRNRRKYLVDNVEDNIPVLISMKKDDSIEMESGGRTLVDEVSFDQNDTVMHYTGGQPINTSYNPTLTAFEIDWKQFAGAMTINGLEQRKNSGPEGVIKLAKARMQVLESSLKNFLEQDLISDGTADGGLQIGGLKYWISTTPTSGTVGGIDRSTTAGAFARNFKFDTINDSTGGAPGGAATTASNIQKYINYCVNSTTRGSDRVSVLLAGQQMFENLQSSMQSLQRFVDESKVARGGFPKLDYLGIPVYMCGGINFSGYTQIQTDRIYGVNTKYTKLRVHKDAYFEPLEDIQSINQDAKCQLVIFMGNMTCSFPKGNFVMFDS